MRHGSARRLSALAAVLLTLALLLPSCGTAHPTAPPEAPSPAESPASPDAASPATNASVAPDGAAQDGGNTSPSAPGEEATAPDALPSPDASGEAQTAAEPSAPTGSGTGAADKGNPSASGGKGGDIVTKTLKLDAPSTAGALRVDGAHLVGSDGAAVQLRGISTHGIAWYPDYINSDAFRQFRYEWGANVIRLAMYTAGGGGYCTGGDKAAQKQLIRDGVKYATEQDMYVIVDWHVLGEQDPNTYVGEAKDFFAEMSAEFAGNENVLYEICNEPNGGTSWQDIKRYASEVIPVIRENAPDAVIIVGTPNWSQFVDEAAADPITDYGNLVYTLHFYAATHKSDLRERAQKAIDAGLPLFVSEFGICDASGNGALDYEQASLWLDLLDKYGISFVDWNLSNKDESSAIISPSCNRTSGFADSDLSESGKWLKKTLTEHAGVSGTTAAASPAPFSSPMPSGGGTTASTTPSTAAPTPTAPPSGAAASPAPTGGSAVLSGDGIEVTAALANSWESDGKTFRQYVLTVKNVSGSACSSWTVSLEFDAPVALSDGWNADYAAEGSTLRVSSKDYNGALDAGASATDVGFIVSGGALAQ